jgi:hypothetical protein
LSGLDGEMKPVKVRLSEAPLFDFEQLCRFKFFEVRADTALSRSHVLRECGLSWKAGVVVPGIFEQHGVREFSADRDIAVREDEIGHLGEAVTRREIGTDDFDVSFSQNVADVPLGLKFHHCHYTRRATRYPLVIHV